MTSGAAGGGRPVPVVTVGLALRLAILAAFAAFAAFAAVATPAGAVESERLYLSGRGPADAVPWAFQVSAGRRAGEWGTLPVPSQWELHGFGTYRYGMDDPGADESGRYRVRFAAPASWSGRRISLVFEGVMTDCTATLNGAPLLPVHRGGFTRFRYDVTTLLRPGAGNLLEVDVDERSADGSVERAERSADYWLFGGIYRPVYLEATPLPAIDRVRIDARHDGRLEAVVNVAAESATTAATLDLRGEVRDRASGAVVHRFAAPIEEGAARISERVDGIRPWSAEEPRLYELRLVLAHAGGDAAAEPARAIHQRSEVFGFRTFAVAPGAGLVVNGRRVLLKGVDRHSFWPTTGRALDPAVNRRDAELLKALNANAVRTSHYPPDPEFLRACDELGLYVVDELPGWHDAYADAVGRDLVREMVERDHNHPSVVAWANGNEGGWNLELDGELARHDLQLRPVLHPGDVHGGVDAAHYPSWDELRARLDPAALRNRWRRFVLGPLPIVLPTEALHGLYDGGLGAGLEDYWELMRASPIAGGLFLWTFVDEGVVRGDRGGAIDTFANYGADGVVGPFREQEASFWAVRATWSPIAVVESEVERTADGGARLTIENRYDLTSLERARLLWEWLRLPGPGGGSEQPLARGSMAAPALEPGARAAVTLAGPPAAAAGADAAPSSPLEPDALRLRALDREGREVSAWVLPVRGGALDRAPATAPSPRAAALGEAPPTAEDSIGAREAGAALADASTLATSEPVLLAAGDAAAEIDPRRGRLLALRAGSRRVVFHDGPRAAGEAAQRLVAGRRFRDGDDDGVELRWEGALEEARFTLERSGWLRVDYVLRVDRPSALAGVVFGLDEGTVRGMRWLGLGPYRVWGNRRQGGLLGLWETERNDTATGVDWRYPEFAGFYAGVHWATLAMEGGALTVALEDPTLHLGVLRPRFAEGLAPDGRELARHTRVATHDGSLAILHAIPGIGTKFHTAEELGPQGRERLAPGRYRGRFRLRVESEGR